VIAARQPYSVRGTRAISQRPPSFGAPALLEVLNLSSAGRDRGAKPFPL
jgi:hypothetical protein